jgi:hypothetical protein
MDHSRVSFEVIDLSWPVVETKVAPWGGDDHTIIRYPHRGGAVGRSFDLTSPIEVLLTPDRLDMYRVKTMLWNEGRSTLTKVATRVVDRLVGPP